MFQGRTTSTGSCFGSSSTFDHCRVGERTTGNHNRLSSDSLLVEEWKELSVDERERIYEEIHGVAKDLPETPELIAETLPKLREELQKIPKVERKAYERAVFLKPSIEDDCKFNLMFLRADRHDPKKAAHRICRFFTHKLELFGDDKLAKRITIEDLSEEDVDSMKHGDMCVLKFPDQSGRKVVFSDVRDLKFANWKAATRGVWYNFMRLAEDEAQQIKGIVNITFATSSNVINGKNFELVRKLNKVDSIPLRFVALHYCYNDPIQRPLMYLFQGAIGGQSRLRFRAHYGTSMEARYNLLTYGIRVPDALINGNSDEKVRFYDRNIEEQRERERTETQEEMLSIMTRKDICALYPNSNDVLVGRGRPYHTFPGNVRLTTLVDGYRNSYAASSERLDKTVIAMEIFERIRASGGRFLERNSQGWSQVDEKAARIKICQAIRMKLRLQEKGSSDAKKPLVAFSSDDSTNFPKKMRYTPT